MLIEKVKKLTLLDRFVYWIKERESIRLKKEAGEDPSWTDDEILQRYRFCNVRRMDDKVSKWLLTNWYEPNHNHPNMLVAVALARFINLPSSLALVGFPVLWDIKHIKKQLRERRKLGLPVFNSAYMVRGNDGIDKVECVVKYYVNPLLRNPPDIDTSSMEESWKAIKSYYGFGSFMAGQVVADLRHALTGSWEDAKYWAPAGPGSIRGLNRLLGRPLRSPMKQLVFLNWLRGVMDYSIIKLSESITDRMEMIDWQNCCCEYDKYSRVLLGEGKPKQIYKRV